MGRAQGKEFLLKFLKSRKGQVLAGVATVILAAGVSYAAWSIITASGTGGAKVGSLVAPTITDAVTATPADLYPATFPTATGSLKLQINNPNAGSLYLKSVTVDDDALTGGAVGCTPIQQYTFIAGQAGWLDANPPATINIPVGILVAAGPSQVNVPNAIGLIDTTPSVCQGAVVSGFSVTNATFSTAP
jgi:hypothetical protein